MENLEKRVTREANRMRRETVIGKAIDGVVTNQQAADLLGVTARQIKRLKGRYRRYEPSGVADGRSTTSRRRRKPLRTVETICVLKETVYQDFSVQHFYEYLIEEHGIDDVSYSFVLRLLQRHGLVERTPRRGQYRRRRPRQPMVGMRVHLDRSTHHWLGEQHEAWDLTVALDDADGRVLSAHFAPEEGTMTTLQALFDVLTHFGRFAELYTDRGGHFCKTTNRHKGPDELQNTQVARVLKALSIRPIWARSPQARGRSERVFRTFQDRLINELKLHRITDYQAANEYLHKVFIPKYNQRFVVKPKLCGSAFTPVPALDLHLLLSTHTARVVRNDYTVMFHTMVLQLPRSAPRGIPGKEVIVHTFLDGTLGVSFQGRLVACFTADGLAVRLPETRSPATLANQPRPTLPGPQTRPPEAFDQSFWRFINRHPRGQPASPVISRHGLFRVRW